MHRTFWSLAIVLAIGTMGTALATTIVVHPGESIQAAVDAAPSGATIEVEPGVYHETGTVRAVTVTKPGIGLIAASGPGRPVVIEQAGTQTQGVWVSPADSLAPEDVELPPCGVSGERLAGFQLSGFTIRGFDRFGAYLACVDGFLIDRNEVHANLTYAVFPVRSSQGRITRNRASGTLSDACLYTGQDDGILVDHNEATDCLIGLQIENSVHVTMTHNVAIGNTAGMIVDVIDGRQVKVESDNTVTDNVFLNNNRPNTAPPDVETSGLPPGMGLILVGADRTLIARNTIAGNSFAGLSFTSFCISSPGVCSHPLDIDPRPDMNVVVDNRFDGNANDVIYLPLGGKGNCFDRNMPKTVDEGLPPCH